MSLDRFQRMEFSNKTFCDIDCTCLTHPIPGQSVFMIKFCCLLFLAVKIPFVRMFRNLQGESANAIRRKSSRTSKEEQFEPEAPR